MADGLSVAVANAALNNIVSADWAFAGLFTGPPGVSGTANVSTVTTRLSATWGSASNSANLSTVAITNEPEWSSWAGTNGEVVTDTGWFSLVTSGAFGGSIALSASVTMDTGDSLTLLSASISLPSAS